MPEWLRDRLPPSLDPGRPARRLAAKAAGLAAAEPRILACANCQPAARG